jgi:peptide/nickel transport system substrate-binding protein
MKFKKILVLFLSLILVLSVGCGKKEEVSTEPENEENATNVIEEAEKIKDGGMMVFGIGDDPKILHPFYATDRVTMTIDNALFDPLFVRDGNETRYYLAENVSVSEDNLTYTVKLKEGVKWHDGENLTADDLIFTLEKLIDEKQNANAYQNFIIDGKPISFEKVDDLTVKIILPEVSVPFIETLAGVTPIAKHIFEGEEDFTKSEKNENPIGTGSFKMREWNKGESIILERFDDYHNGKPHLDQVVYRVVADSNAANVAFENGEISVRYIDVNEYEKYQNSNDFKVYGFDEGMLNYMAFKLNNDDLKDKKVRQAIAYALDKEEIIKGAYDSLEYAVPAYTVLTPQTLYYTEDVNKYEHNVELAKDLLKESGKENIKLTLGYISTSKEQEKEALIIQQKLKEIGIELELMPLDRGAFYQKLFEPDNRDFDLVFNGYIMGQEPDSYKLIFTKGGPYNFVGYENEEMDKMWIQGPIEIDKAKRQELYENIQKQIMDEMIQYPICYPKALIAVSGNIGGVEESKLMPIFIFEDLSKLYIIE